MVKKSSDMTGPGRGGTGRISRRGFLAGAAFGAGSGLAGVLVPPLVSRAVSAAVPRQGNDIAAGEAYDCNQHDYVYLIDTYKCIGCGMCVRACKAENDVPDGFYRTWVERYLVPEIGHSKAEIDSPAGGISGFRPEEVKYAAAKGFFVPKMCNHCRHTPCVQVCPVGASYTTRDGVVLVDGERCIGCGYCVQACPYGSRFLHPVTHTASKCTLCYHRITKGLRPACVGACPRGARMLGDLKSKDDPVRRALATERINVLQPDLLTVPYCFYLGLDREVR